MNLKQFLEAIQAIGRTQEEQAAVLGVSVRQVQRWKKGELPAAFKKIPPTILRALANDLEQVQQIQQ